MAAQKMNMRPEERIPNCRSWKSTMAANSCEEEIGALVCVGGDIGQEGERREERGEGVREERRERRGGRVYPRPHRPTPIGIARV